MLFRPSIYALPPFDHPSYFRHRSEVLIDEFRRSDNLFVRLRFRALWLALLESFWQGEIDYADWR